MMQMRVVGQIEAIRGQVSTLGSLRSTIRKLKDSWGEWHKFLFCEVFSNHYGASIRCYVRHIHDN